MKQMMLKIKLGFIALIFVMSAQLVQAQSSIEFFENFEDFSSNWNDHPNWTVIDVDGLTDNIWTNSNWSISSSWQVAMTSSNFTSPGQADDWMILPQVTLANANTPYLRWVGSSYTSNNNTGSDYSDYEVLISTTNNDIASFSVLETVLQEPRNQTSHFIDLSAYIGQQVYIAFRNISDDKYILRIHEMEIGSTMANDGKLSLYSFNDQWNMVNNSINDLSFQVTNTGTASISNFTVKWDVDQGAQTGQKIFYTSLPSNGSMSSALSFTSPYPNTGAVGHHELKVWLELTTGDMIPENDTLYLDFYTLSQSGDKSVVIDEGTGTWCSYCTDGMARLDAIKSQYGDQVIPIGLHSSDPMSTPQSDSLIDGFITGFPRAAFDRYQFSPADDLAWSRGVWADKMPERLSLKTPFDITLSHDYDPTTREITAYVSVTSYSEVNQDLAIGFYLIEDYVSGDSEYNQNNYYNTTSGHPYQGMGSPIVNFEHMHVFREAVGSVWGNTGTIPNPTADGAVYHQSFTHTLPTTYDATHGDDVDPNNIILVAFVARQDSEDYQIYNATEKHLTDVSTAVTPLETLGVRVYPVPASIELTIQSEKLDLTQCKIELIDLFGKSVSIDTQTKHKAKLNVEGFANGIYLLKLSDGKNVSVQRIIISD